MKRGWIALLMIALSLVGGIFDYVYVESNTAAYMSMLSDAEEKMKQNQVLEAESAAKRLEHRFISQSGILDAFNPHGESKSISCDLSVLTVYAGTGETEEFLATAARVGREINALRESKQLRWGNIF